MQRRVLTVGPRLGSVARPLSSEQQDKSIQENANAQKCFNGNFNLFIYLSVEQLVASKNKQKKKKRKIKDRAHQGARNP